MNINPISSTPSYGLTDKDRQMIDDLIVNANVSDGVENYDDLMAAMSGSNEIINHASYDCGKLLDVTI